MLLTLLLSRAARADEECHEAVTVEWRKVEPNGEIDWKKTPFKTAKARFCTSTFDGEKATDHARWSLDYGGGKTFSSWTLIRTAATSEWKRVSKDYRRDPPKGILELLTISTDERGRTIVKGLHSDISYKVALSASFVLPKRSSKPP